MAMAESMTGAAESAAPLLAIGVGCRKHCPRADIVALIRAVVSDCADAPARRCLFTVRDKQGDDELAAAARALGLDLVFLAREALKAATPRLLTTSAPAERRFGLPSIAEAAALAGAGEGGRLIGPRRVGRGVTCAAAIGVATWAPT
jgi:cobalt-precorrin 5A hydrolase